MNRILKAIWYFPGLWELLRRRRERREQIISDAAHDIQGQTLKTALEQNCNLWELIELIDRDRMRLDRAFDLLVRAGPHIPPGSDLSSELQAFMSEWLSRRPNVRIEALAKKLRGRR